MRHTDDVTHVHWQAGTDESKNLIAYLKTLGVEKWLCHIDQHETTDTVRAHMQHTLLLDD